MKPMEYDFSNIVNKKDQCENNEEQGCHSGDRRSIHTQYKVSLFNTIMSQMY